MWRSRYGLFATLFGEDFRATPAETRRPLPGDELIEDRVIAATHAVTIEAEAAAIWPWLVQMGGGRAGWYSYDWIDNLARPSAREILCEWQGLEQGSVVPAYPGASDWFVAEVVDPNRCLVLTMPRRRGHARATWTLYLDPLPDCSTRLIVRIVLGYQPLGLPRVLLRWMGRLAHHVMQTRQLANLKWRAEAAPCGASDGLEP